MIINSLLAKADWYLKWGTSGDVRPYVFVRPENKIQSPGCRHRSDWFPMEPVYLNPLEIENLEFAEEIYYIEGRAFGPSMAMTRWVYYDCAIIPGFVAGFAMRTSKIPENIRSVMRIKEDQEWTPLSLFIIIPTMAKGQWAAHNLCAINSLLPEKERLYALGFWVRPWSVVCQCGVLHWSLMGKPCVKIT